MRVVHVISHPEVMVDPLRPVPRWSLSDRGVARMRLYAENFDGAGLRRVFASGETKAIEAAGLLAARFGVGVEIEPALHENDRGATGFLPPAEFEATADAFFARPHESIRGWERAGDAQARIAAAVDGILARVAEDPTIAIVAHGGVGTLLLCLYLKRPITRSLDQPFQGHAWRFDADTGAVISGWEPIAPR